MDNEKALEVFEQLKIADRNLGLQVQGREETYKIAIKAIEKQIPKKILADKLDKNLNICPNCKFDWYGVVLRNCANCGQRLEE